MGTCEQCKHWKATIYEYGKCEVIKEEVEVEVVAGWEGGYVDHIETPKTFGCNKFEKK